MSTKAAHQVGRFAILLTSALAACVLAIVSWFSEARVAPLPEVEAALPRERPLFRKHPLVILPKAGADLSDLVPLPELQRVLSLCEPYWDYRRPSDLLHALRLWGPAAVFPDHATFPVPVTALAPSSRDMLKFFLDDSVFTRRHGTPYFFPSSYGIGARRDYDTAAAAHFDDFLHVAAEIGLPLDSRLVCGGREFQVVDVLTHSLMWFHPEQEMEFTAVAYALYLDGPAWSDRFGVSYTFDEIASALVARDLSKCSCYGTHVPYALTVLLAVDAEEAILSPGTREKVSSRLQALAKALEASQEPAGSWPKTWFGGVPIGASEREEVERLRATGHHLEWIALAPSHLRPSTEHVARAVRFLLHFVQDVNTAVASQARYFTDLSHAARALVLLRGHRFAAELMSEQWAMRAAGMPPLRAPRGPEMPPLGDAKRAKEALDKPTAHSN